MEINYLFISFQIVFIALKSIAVACFVKK